jgi:hypothetical protein
MVHYTYSLDPSTAFESSFILLDLMIHYKIQFYTISKQFKKRIKNTPEDL